ncbi:outer membrane protein [Rhodoblastus acidophilus]|uniref:OmpW/AlkL family protein n=1 Tax=Rhodoblastus acidophilus TaxID=1074 RepID=UPI002225191C|nr:OmpW family outer membrane protein [Rhodoblastus acidophilus]MCW2315521.1 outer membrane protein [Rhodoblastus acidophilus]
MKQIVSGAFAAALLASVAVPAFAADLPSTKAAPALPAIDTFDPFLIRLRGLAVLPDASGTKLNGATLGGAKLSDNGIPEVDFTYFFTKNIAAELIAGVTHHRLTAGGSNVALANTTLLPPTLTLQYHFALGQLDPYVGVGVNYTWFLGTKSPALNGVVNIHSAVAPAFQFGADYYLTKNWLVNVDAKYIMLETDANVGGHNNLQLKVNPWIVGAGIGYRFGVADVAAIVAKY